MQKIILDVDTGIDDALAIAYLLAHKQVEPIGITTSYGNVYRDTAYENTLKILNALHRNDIKVYKGSEHSLRDNFEVREICYIVHGKNGIGDVDLETPEVVEEKQMAWDFMVDSALKYGDQLTIIAVGPMTNLAKAYEKNPEAIKKAKIVAMSGALTVQGNASQYAEANVIEDPEAAKIIYEADLNVTMIGLDVTLQTFVDEKKIESWRVHQNAAAKTLCDMSVYYYRFEAEHEGDPTGCLHDPLAVATAINPDIISQYLNTDITVELEEPSRGRTITQKSCIQNGPDKTKVALQVKEKEFVDEFISSIDSLLATL